MGVTKRRKKWLNLDWEDPRKETTKMAKRENPKKNKHLTMEERIEIEECLSKRMTFKDIARLIEKDPTTVSYESTGIASSRKKGRARYCFVLRLYATGARNVLPHPADLFVFTIAAPLHSLNTRTCLQKREKGFH